VIADNDTLQPDVVGPRRGRRDPDQGTVFEVFPLLHRRPSALRCGWSMAGCKVVMPWAAPIGSAKGIINRDALKAGCCADRLPDITLVVDAGLGAARSHAAPRAGTWLRRRAAQHTRDRQGHRSRRYGERVSVLPSEGRPHCIRSRADGKGPRDFASPFNPCHRDTVLACRILISSIPVVDSVALGWRGLTKPRRSATIQCAAKDLKRPRQALQIVSDALAVTKGHADQARRPNDYWPARAIVAGAAHLPSRSGRPRRRADLAEIRSAKLTLGISTPWTTEGA